jgi:Sec-independent protein secretion pathway component TatC
MTTASPPKSNGKAEFDPDQYRMTIGEHLEELRTRLILSIVGVFLAFIVCFVFSDRVITAFCAPLINTLSKHDINTQLITDEVGEGFMVAIQISLITALAIAGPWALYQLWQFVAAGLYPHERKYITKYMPLSIGLLVTGMLFVYFLVLPWTLDFFIAWSTGIKVPLDKTAVVETTGPATPGAPAPSPPVLVPFLKGNPSKMVEGMIWYDTVQQRLKFCLKGEPRVIAINSDNLLAPEIKLETYIDLVVGMLITFALSFQLPLVVLALERIGILDLDALRSMRKYVYFAMTIVAAVITPGDVITATIALMVPLCLLYELGVWLARMGHKNEADGDALHRA